MGVLDKFLNIMKLSDDDDEYENEDFFDEDDLDDDYEEEKTRKRFFGKDKHSDEETQHHEDDGYTAKASSDNKVTQIRQSGRRPQAANMEVCVIKPSSVDDAREITETLLGGSTVILNLEGLDLEIAQRIIDFTSGATFAIDGNLQKISNFIFLLTPTNVGISGDLQDLLNTSFDVSSISKRY